MKKIKLLLSTVILISVAKGQDLDITLLNSSESRSLTKTADTLTVLQQKDNDNVAIIKLKMLNTTIDFNATFNDYGNNTDRKSVV